MKDFYENNRIGILITLAVLIIGNIVYFGLGFSSNETPIDTKIFEDLKVKVAYTPEGNMKLFVNAKNNELSKLKTVEGQNLPETDTIIFGYDEAMMMKREKLFTNMGDELKDFFGVNVKVGGILKKTDSIIDDFHFVTDATFDRINGEEKKVFVIAQEDGAAIFLTYLHNENEKTTLQLEEGDLAKYTTTEQDSKTYYPLILGSTEARMMRESKEFNKVGDKIQEEDKDFIVVGVLKQTNTGIDMMHIISLTKEELI